MMFSSTTPDVLKPLQIAEQPEQAEDQITGAEGIT